MLTQDRYRAILDLLEEKNSVTVSELTKLLDSSESTIRRDLSALDEMGKLTKVFGGATSITRNEGIFEDAVSNRETVMSDEKDLVAEYCAKLIHDSDFVYIDAGTTTLKLVDHITNTNATYVTNGITHARMLIHKGMQTYIVGGKIKPLTEAVVGAEAIKSINCFNFTKAFMGANGIDIRSYKGNGNQQILYGICSCRPFKISQGVSCNICPSAKMLYNHRQTAYAGLFAGNGDKGGKK